MPRTEKNNPNREQSGIQTSSTQLTKNI